MKTLYIIYVAIPEYLFNTKLKYCISNAYDFKIKANKMFGLYAWSSDKDIIKEFLNTRNSLIYTLIVADKNDYTNDFSILKRKYSDLKLEPRDFSYTDKNGNLSSLSIITTENEYKCATSEAREYLFDLGPKVYKNIPYWIFNKKIRKALETLGYTKRYMQVFNIPDSKKTKEITELKSPLDNIYKINQVGILLFLFHYLFYGEAK